MIYLDYAATTPLRREVLNEMMPYLTTEYGNPSSQYGIGFNAMQAISKARETIAKTINAEPDEIFFTSGGSEANSWAIKGTLFRYSRNIITTPIEHHSLLNACETITGINGGMISFLTMNEHGLVNVDDLHKLEEDHCSLVSVMMLNNELGTIEPIREISKYTQNPHTLLHTDAVQAYGHMPIDVKKLGVDMLSASSHKIYGPKGVGFLFIRKGAQSEVRPLINGGQQERNMRGGTENVAGIVGMAKAAELAMSEMDDINLKNRKLKEALYYIIKFRNGIINSPSNGSYSHINFRFEGIRAEIWNEFFKEYGICVSSGSACNSLSNEPSHVLTAIGLSPKEADESLRISLGKDTTMDDIRQFEKVLDVGLSLFQ